MINFAINISITLAVSPLPYKDLKKDFLSKKTIARQGPNAIAVLLFSQH